MCMDEFVKRLYDFMGIYRICWSQNNHYRYLSIFIDILPIFFHKFQHKRACSTVSIFQWKNRFFFRFFEEKSANLPIFPLIDFSSIFSSRCRPKIDFSAIYRPKKTIFYSLVLIC